MASPLDEVIPTPTVRERFERRINAPADVVMRTAYEIDMQSILPIRAIVSARKFILRGTADKRVPKGLVEETRDLGWGTLVEEPGRLLVCGAACQPWIGDVKFTAIPRDEFASFSEPDQVKIVWSLEANEIEPGITEFVHEVRAVATDDEARRKFLSYWRWARFGIVAIRWLLLPAIEKRAEENDSWGESWRAMSHRELKDTSKFDFARRLGLELGDVSRVSMNEVPQNAVADLYIKDDVCPVCGTETIGNDRVCVSVNPVFREFSNLSFAAWAHLECFERCPILAEPTPIPW